MKNSHLKSRESYQHIDQKIKTAIDQTQRSKAASHLLIYQKTQGLRSSGTSVKNTGRHVHSHQITEDEIRMKRNINYQLALNGFVRKQYITSQIDQTNPITVANPNIKMYASLSEFKKYGVMQKGLRR